MDGDSLVAVVRGSKCPGLSVTLLRDAYFRGDKRKFNMYNGYRGINQCNAQTNTERIPQNIPKYNVTYQFANYYKPSVHCVLPSPYQTTKRTCVKNLRGYSKTRRQQTCRHKRYNKNVDTNLQNRHVIDSNFDRSLSSVDARSSSQKELTKYMYDYLKSESLVPNVDVRYFTEIKKALRNGLRRIADNRAIPCPVRRSRYYRHKRYGNCSKHSLTDSAPYGTKMLKHTKSSNISRHKCFCRQPVTCECDTTRKPSNHIYTKYFNKLNSKKSSKSQLKQNMFDVCPPGDFTESKNQKVFDVICKWMNDIPKHPNFDENDKSKQDMLIRNLAESLKELFNNEDFVARARPEILKCLNDLPILRPDDATDEIRLIEDLIIDLINRFIKLAESEFIECISSEIKKITFENNTSAGNIQSKINDFANELKPIALKRPTDDETYKEILKEKLIELLKSHNLVNDLNDTEKINELADKFADRLCHIYIYSSPNNESETFFGIEEKKKVFNWLQDTPEFSYKNLNECSELIDLLINKCKNYKSEDIKNKVTEKKLHNDIENCLDSIASKLHISLNKERKEELIKQLKTLLFGLDNFNEDDDDDDDTSLGTILEWLLTIPGLSEQNILKNEKEINNYAKLMKQVQTQKNNKLSNVKKVIANWLQEFLRKNNIQLDPKVYDNLINKLIHKINDMSTSAPVVNKQRKRWDDQDTRVKFSDIKHIIDVCCSDFGVNVKEVTKRKITEEILKNITDQNILSDKILKNLISILTKETSLGQTTIKKLCNEIIHHVNKFYSSKGNGRNYMTAQNDGSHQEETLLMNLSLNNPSLHKSKSNKNIQTQQNEKEAKKLHKSEGNEREKKSNHINRNEISQNKSSTNDTFEITESEASREMLGPNPLGNIKNTDDKETSMKEFYRESSSILENIKAVSKNLLNKKIDKLKMLKENNRRHSRKVDNSTQTEKENLSFDNNFTTSTPLDYSQKDVFIDVKATSTENNEIDKNYGVQEDLSDHTKYLNDARSTIHSWLKLCNINMSTLDMNNLTELILSDYLERQKYLQLSGVKTTRNDEIEQLKYQIYRQMYKLTNSETLQCVMEKVTDLYENLKNLKHSTNFQEKQISDNNLTTLSIEDINELGQKIRLWLNSISSQFYLPSDKKYQDNLIHELSKRLHLLKREDNYKAHGKNAINTWLQKVLNVSDKNILKDFAESLLMNLENDSLRDTQIPIQDISEFLVENLRGAILDWIRETKPFPNNIMTNLPLLENFASMLGNDLKRVFENNSNIWSNDFENLLIEEIVRNLKTILYHDNKPPTFYQKLAKSLISYIKRLRLFHDISDRLTMNPNQNSALRDELKYSNEMKQAILLWSKNLALETGKSFEDIEESIRDFIEYLLTYIIEDVNSIENRLKEDTLKLLKGIPLKVHQERNNVLQAYIASLINIIKNNLNPHSTVEITKQERKDMLTSPASEKKLDDEIRDIVKNWCDILPFHVDSVYSKEKIKEVRHNLASHIIQFINKLNSNGSVPEKNVNKMLRDDIKDQLKTLHISPDLEKCIDLLIGVLIEKLKDANCLNVKESISSIYNLLLHETVNKTLSLIDNPTGNDRISFDMLKEKLANAFIELHHPIDDVDVRNKYKDKLCNVIDKFCKDYLDQGLITPRNSEKVKEDLDDALRNVSIPKLMISRATSGNIDENVETKRHISIQCDLKVPPSTLSTEDIELLNNIRARSDSLQESLKTIRKDVSISPMPVDADTQTETQSDRSIIDGITQTSKHSSKERVSLRKDTPPQLSPQVVVKEYYWDTSGSNHSLRMSILSELSQKIHPSPSVIEQRENLVKKQLVSTGQQTKMNNTDVNKGKTKEAAHTQTDIPKKRTKNNFQQTSNTFEPVILSKSHLEVNPKRNKDEIEDFNDDDDNIDEEIDPKSKRLVIPSDHIPSRHKIRLEGDKDIHTKKNKARKDIISDVSKMISGNREIENYHDMYKYNKDGQTCSCKDYIFSKCRNRMNACGRQPHLRHCARGYGCYCPCPSNLFFKRDF